MPDPTFKLSFFYPFDPVPADLHAIGIGGPDEEYFSLQIDCASGDLYELTVWTDIYLARVQQHAHKSGDRLQGQYLLLPDLVVASKDVGLIEQIVADLIETQRLRPEWLIPDECTVSWEELSPKPADRDDADDAWLGMPVSLAEDVGWELLPWASRRIGPEGHF